MPECPHCGGDVPIHSLVEPRIARLEAQAAELDRLARLAYARAGFSDPTIAPLTLVKGGRDA
jgi:hypothetical protein